MQVRIGCPIVTLSIGEVLVARQALSPTAASVAKTDFLIVALPFVFLYVLACLTAGAASWALWQGHSRSRILLTILLAEFVVGDAAMLFVARRLVEISASELIVSIVGFSVLAFLCLWYLYRKGSVVAYYDSVRSGVLPARA